jgi:hypothetical protein
MTVHDARRTCATLLAALEVRPRVIMRIRRHADVSVTLEIYSNASPMATSEALRRLGEPLRCAGQFSSSLVYLPYFAAVLAAREALTNSGKGL